MWWGLHKNSKSMGIWGVSRSLNRWRRWESGALTESLEALSPFPHTLPYVSLPSGCSSISFIIFFYNKLVNIFPGVLWAILVNYGTQGEGYGNIDLYPVRRIDDKLGLEIAIWSVCLLAGGRESCGTEPFNLWSLMLSPGRYVGIELNCRTPSSFPRELLGGENATHIWWLDVSEVKYCLSSKGETHRRYVFSYMTAITYRPFYHSHRPTHIQGKRI